MKLPTAPCCSSASIPKQSTRPAARLEIGAARAGRSLEGFQSIFITPNDGVG